KIEMGPVSWKELTELAQAGILQSSDKVWTEGMADWGKAINQKGLFDGADVQETATTARKKSPVSRKGPTGPPGRRSRRDDDDEDSDDPRVKNRLAREREEANAKAYIGLKIGLTIVGVLLVLATCTGGIGWMLWA